MRYTGSLFRMSPRWRWLNWPILASGAGGSAVALWLEEEPLLIAGEVCPALAVLVGMGALLCRFYHQIFEAAKLRPQDSSATPKHDSPIE